MDGPRSSLKSTPGLKTVRTVHDLRAAVHDWRGQGHSVGLVPTMGALHDGHLSLVHEARRRADRTVVSIFVNPTQFSPTEDLDRYPRQEAEDAKLLEDADCDLLFLPDAQALYRPDATLTISPGGPALGLEGDFRPRMFGGVALVVAKLFNLVQPDLAVFGEKDWQQLAVIRRLARDLDIPVQIIGHPTTRDAQGLALSSRNAYLSDAERAIARHLNTILRDAGQQAASGRALSEIEHQAHDVLIQAGFDSVDYVAVRDAETLAPFPENRVTGSARILAAVWLGHTRLIDNMAVGRDPG